MRAQEFTKEATYPGNIGMMEIAKFFQLANEQQKELFKHLLEKGKKGLAWKLIQDVTNTKLIGTEFNVDEDWRHWVAGLGAASAIAGGGGAAYDTYKAHQAQTDKPAVVAQAPKSDFKKGIEKLSKDAIPKQSVTGSPHEKFLTGAAVAAGISTLSRPTPARAMTLRPFAAAIASASIFVAERIKTASTPLPKASRSSARFAPSQLRTSKSGPSASSVAALSSSAIKTTGLATCSTSLLVIIVVSLLHPAKHLAEFASNLLNLV